MGKLKVIGNPRAMGSPEKRENLKTTGNPRPMSDSGPTMILVVDVDLTEDEAFYGR